MSLADQINKVRAEIRTDGYPMSIGEWMALYDDREIDIHPEFQRFYRWSLSQKSGLIESILLGIPIPPIFVSQRKDGVWDVVDGMQRLSTIYEFIGILRDDQEKTIPALTLEKTKYLPGLEGIKWQDDTDPDHSLATEQRLLIKRAKITVSIILRESDDKAKYELFQRLNTGGSSLTQQEVRNCILVMVNRDLYQWLRNIANHPSFQDCIALSERTLSEQYDVELALRFIIFSTINLDDLNSIGDVGVFLGERMLELACDQTFDRTTAESRFKTTFDLLAETMGDQSFVRFSAEKDRFLGGFILSAFEVVSFGIGFNYQQPTTPDVIKQKIKDLWSNPIYREWSGAGMTATRRLPKLVKLGRDLFKK